MADKNESPFDSFMRDYLLGQQQQAMRKERQDAADAEQRADPDFDGNVPTVRRITNPLYDEAFAAEKDSKLVRGGRDFGEHVQDAAVGLAGTTATILNTGLLAISAAGDGLERIMEGESDWEATKQSLERISSTGEFFRSLESEKSKAFDRITQYRQDRALDQLEAESMAINGRPATAAERLESGFKSAAGSYLGDPGQILTDSIAQLPYLLGGVAAKGITTGTKLASPLIGRMVKAGMTPESALKLVQMGITGGFGASVEGSDAASATYARVKDSENTPFAADPALVSAFQSAEADQLRLLSALAASTEGSSEEAALEAQYQKATQRFNTVNNNLTAGLEAARESAALSAAFKSFTTAGLVSLVTGTALSKWDLNPFTAVGGSSLARTGDNLLKGLMEGVQETIESGTSQASTNIFGNQVLSDKDDVQWDEGVGGAAGTGFVVGMGSTVVTNPRSSVDAALVPLVLASKAVGYVGSRAVAKEQNADMKTAMDTADSIVATATKLATVLPPVLAADGSELTTDTPPELVNMPAGIDVKSQVGLFATGMQYLTGKDMNSKNAVESFHVLGAVLGAANYVHRLRDGLIQTSQDESQTPEVRAEAQRGLDKLATVIDNAKLDKWVEDMPTADIEKDLETLRQNPEEFGTVIAHLAANSPLKMTAKLVDTALEAKSLSPTQRNALVLSKELIEANQELKVGTSPDSSEVSRSIMHTGFPGSTEKESVSQMLRNVTGAFARGETEDAQAYFEKLTKFSQYMTGKAVAFETARTTIENDQKPTKDKITIQGYATFVGGELRYDLPPEMNSSPGSLAMASAVRADADTIVKMVEAVQKRIGLRQGAAPVAASKPPKPTSATTPRPAPKAAAAAPVVTVKPAVKEGPKATPKIDKTDPGNLTDEELDQEIAKVEGKNTYAAKFKYDILTMEQYRRIEAKSQTSPEPAGSLVGKAAPKRKKSQTVTVKDIHDLADRKGIPWDNNKIFMNFTESVTGKRHLDKLEPRELVKLAIALAKKDPVKALVKEGAKVIPDTVPAAVTPSQQAVTPLVLEKSKNHLTGLQPGYQRVDNTDVATNNALNHLSQSFTTSDKPGLIDLSEILGDFNKLEEALELADKKESATLGRVYDIKDELIERLQTLLGRGSANKLAALFAGVNLWQKAENHHLYATRWSAESGIVYDKDVAQIMAWTGVQHVMGMLNPISWSNDKIQEMEETYGPEIYDLLAEGWVPMSDQLEQVARKLQINLGLKANSNVSVEYTEGTMLALAGRILEAMIYRPGRDATENSPALEEYAGVIEHQHILTQDKKSGYNAKEKKIIWIEGELRSWIKMGFNKSDDLFDAARMLEKIIPGRTAINVARVGKPVTEVNPNYRGSQQKIGEEQKKALIAQGGNAYKLSPLFHSMLKIFKPTDPNFFRLFGLDMEVEKFPTGKGALSISQTARKGKYRTMFSDLKTIVQHVWKLEDYADTQEKKPKLTDIPSYFEHEMAVNGRAMTMGTSPQSSKAYRDIFSVAQYSVDPTKTNLFFKLAIAQGFGIKIDKQPFDDSIAQLESLLKKASMVYALDAAFRFGSNYDYSGKAAELEADMVAIEKLAFPLHQGGLNLELTSHLRSSLLHMAQYQKGQPFISSHQIEVDGLTDGPINLMMLLGLHGSLEKMEPFLALGGMFFGGKILTSQEMATKIDVWFKGKKDLYALAAKEAEALVKTRYDAILKGVKDSNEKPQWLAQNLWRTKNLMVAMLSMTNEAGLSTGDVMAQAMTYAREFTKKPTQTAGYLQGVDSLSGDLLDTILEALSARIDKGELLPGTQERDDINTFFTFALGENSNSGIYLNGQPKAYQDFVWDGKPLSHEQRMTARASIRVYLGNALFNGLLPLIGHQRKVMSAAVTIMQARVQYADSVYQAKYKKKQAELVKANKLLLGQALSKDHENALMGSIWKKLIPHPVIRNTAGLPVANVGRNNFMAHKKDVDYKKGRNVFTEFFASEGDDSFTHVSPMSEMVFDKPGVSFAGNSIQAAGDGSMMVGASVNAKKPFLDMFDGAYMNPEHVEELGTLLNEEVSKNWENDYIGAILVSLAETSSDEFDAWADGAYNENGDNIRALVAHAESVLETQHHEQISMRQKIESRPHTVSHMQIAVTPHVVDAIGPLYSTTLGTTTTDPLLDLALDSLGHVDNGIRKLSKGDVLHLMNNHTFENPVLSGLWRMLAPLVSDSLTFFTSSDPQALGEFFALSEGEKMRDTANGVSIGDRVYVRSVNGEVIMHELLHHATKALTATYFTNPAALTAQQREAMKNLLELMDQFFWQRSETLPPIQQEMADHVRAVMDGYLANGDTNSALQEFLAYSLSNFHLQRQLGNTQSKLAKLTQAVFDAIKKLFGFPNGTKSDSMLAQMLSNFEALTKDAVGIVYPMSIDTALESINPTLALSYGSVLKKLSERSLTQPRALGAAVAGHTRMLDLGKTGLFPLTNEQQTAAEHVQAMFALGLQFKPDVNTVLQRVVDALRTAGVTAWRTNDDPTDAADIKRAEARFAFFFENLSNKHDRAADILALSLVSPEFNERLSAIALPFQKVDKSTLNSWMDSLSSVVSNWFDTGRDIKPGSSLASALDITAMRLQKSLTASVKRQQSKPGYYRQATQKLSEGVQWVGEKAGQTAAAREAMNKNKDWISNGLNVLAGGLNDSFANQTGNMIISLSNHMKGFAPIRELIQELPGTVSDNAKLIQAKGLADRMISAVRQSFREQVPVTVKSWFKNLTEEQDNTMHRVIGQFGVYTLSQGMKDRLAEILLDPTNAIRDATATLKGTNPSGQRDLMVQYAKQLGDQMAETGQNALYRNTRAIEGLEVHMVPGVTASPLSVTESEALDDLSTLQALTHLTRLERQVSLDLVRNEPEAFWKTAALINAFFVFDTRRAGEHSASLNFQKGWIPVEADGRKKVRLVPASEIKKAERMGWVVVGKFESDFEQKLGLVYMATTVGKTPTLSGGAIHSVDMHMNGMHFHSGLPILPGIQTLITIPSEVKLLQTMILAGKPNLPYTALYDATGEVVGFQRILDPAIVTLHTREVRRISDAAGIWLGRLHEENAASGLNKAAAKLLADTWKNAPADRKMEYVDIKDTEDRVIAHIWESLPYHTKVHMENAYGGHNAKIMIMRSQLIDAVGYHKASVGNFFTGDNRLNTSMNKSVAAFTRQLPFLGKNAYKYLVNTEEGWQGLVATAKDTIIIKSLTVALNNILSNQIQLFMITGNPVWNMRVQAQKYKEVHAYLGYQQRISRLTTEGFVADAKRLIQIDAEQAQIKLAMRKLSIHVLIEAGEFPSIAEGTSEVDEFSSMGDFTSWAEKEIGKLPDAVGTVIDNLVVAKHTSLYKGLDRLVQYGDFVAKATMYEWMMTQDANAKKKALEMFTNSKDTKTTKKMTMMEALHEVALTEVNDEFINYARLPGRMRTYGEDMGLTWFFNYKLRILKMIFRRFRQNPAAFLIGSQVGGMLGIMTLMDSLPWNVNLDFATGIDPMFSAHEAIVWNQFL